MSLLLMYLMGSFSATIAGLMFYMAVENLQSSSSAANRQKHIMTSALFSVWFTPLGAWLPTLSQT